MKRIQCLDGLRAVAIVMVTASHYLPYFLPASYQHYAAMLGAPGVDVFFVISGFLITSLMLREWDRTGTLSLPAFYLRRCLRILPAYFCFLLVVFFFNRLGPLPVDHHAWWYLVTYTYNFNSHLGIASIGQVWSLCVEEHFYLLWPLTVLLLGIKRAPVALIVLIVVAAVLRFWLFSPTGIIDIDYFTFTRLDTIAVGCLLAYAFRTSWIQRIRGENLARIAVLLFMLSVYVLSRSGKYTLGPKHPMEAILISIIIACLVQDATGVAGRLLNSPVMIWIGTLSYSIYLAQTTITTKTIPLGLRIPAMFCYACFSYYLIEAPFLRYKDRISSSRANSQSRSVSA